jgi:hypothetical protein
VTDHFAVAQMRYDAALPPDDRVAAARGAIIEHWWDSVVTDALCDDGPVFQSLTDGLIDLAREFAPVLTATGFKPSPEVAASVGHVLALAMKVAVECNTEALERECLRREAGVRPNAVGL